jgi:hypothetical protein
MGQLTVGLRRFLFLCAVVLVLPAIAAAQASVTLNTYQGPVGTEVTATGEGWPAGALVYAFINQQQVSFRPETVNEDGNFELKFCVPDLRLRSYPTFFTSITGMYSGPIFTITAGDQVDCQSATCRPAFFIGLRGSGESDTREVQVAVDPVTGDPIYESLNDRCFSAN